MNVFARVLLGFGLLAAWPVQAFVDPPWITPEHPQAGETVYVNLRFGTCDGFLVEPIPPEITQIGSAIRILIWSLHYTDPIQCNWPTLEEALPVGSFPSGSYTLQVDRWYQVYGLGTRTETLGILPFTVEGNAVAPTPSAVPALGIPGLILLGLLTGWMARRRLGSAQRTAARNV